jgi:predicted permease
VDAAAAGFAAALTGVTALLVSLLPMVRARGYVPNTLVGSNRTATAGRDRHLVRNALVMSQVALALVLLAGAGIMARSYARLRSVPPGFDPTGVLTVRVALPQAGYPTAGDVARFHLRALDAYAALPGVQSAAAVSKLPLAGAGRADTAVFIEDHPLGMGKMPGIHQVVSVTPDYFPAMGIPLLAGRGFAPPESDHPALDVIVSRAFAEHYWPGAPALGKRIRTAPTTPWSTVVGVAGDVHDTGLERPPDQLVYVPLLAAVGSAGGSWAPREVAFVLRARNRGPDPTRLAEPVRKVIQGLDPGVALHSLSPMGEILSAARARSAATLLFLGVAAAAALGLAGVGIFGIIAYGVSLRRREIGIRLALGARPAGVRRMVARQAVVAAGLGIAGGLAGAAALTRVLGALLFETNPLDPAALAGAALLLLGVAFGASWGPAGRAARVDPASALRAE